MKAGQPECGRPTMNGEGGLATPSMCQCIIFQAQATVDAEAKSEFSLLCQAFCSW